MKWFWRILGGLALALVAAFFVLRVPDTDPAEMLAKYGAPPSRMLAIDGDSNDWWIYRDGGLLSDPFFLYQPWTGSKIKLVRALMKCV